MSPILEDMVNLYFFLCIAFSGNFAPDKGKRCALYPTS